MTISWAENENAAAASVYELDERLDALDAQARESDYPFVAELVPRCFSASASTFPWPA